MIREYVIHGVVVCEPAVIGKHTQFLLRSAQRVYVVIRTAPGWQKRDMVFLTPGQTVEVTGRPVSKGKLVASRIRITDTGRLTEKERVYGDPGK